MQQSVHLHPHQLGMICLEEGAGVVVAIHMEVVGVVVVLHMEVVPHMEGHHHMVAAHRHLAWEECKYLYY